MHSTVAAIKSYQQLQTAHRAAAATLIWRNAHWRVGAVVLVAHVSRVILVYNACTHKCVQMLACDACLCIPVCMYMQTCTCRHAAGEMKRIHILVYLQIQAFLCERGLKVVGAGRRMGVGGRGRRLACPFSWGLGNGIKKGLLCGSSGLRRRSVGSRRLSGRMGKCSGTKV